MSLNKTKKNNRLKKIAASGSISLALMLCLLKGIGAAFTGSLAVLSSMIDSLSDILASLITYIAVKYSGRPASCDYRYGYGKVEALSAVVQAMFIAMSGAFVLYDALRRLALNEPVQQTTIGVIIMVISLILTLVLVIFQRYVAKVTKSKAILADSMHYSVDIMTNGAIIVSLLLIHIWHINWIDAIMAIIVAVYLLYCAFDLAKDSVPLLLDKELSDDIRRDVLRIIRSHPLHPEVHDLRTHDLGGAYLFEFHLELDGKLDLTTAHQYSEEVVELLQKVYPEAQVIVHQEPQGIEDDRLDNRLSNCRV